MNRIDIEDRYRDWWLDKYCNTGSGQDEFRLVTKVRYISQPSGIYGIVELTFEDGTQRLIGGGKTKSGHDVFCPRKCDVVVKSTPDVGAKRR